MNHPGVTYDRPIAEYEQTQREIEKSASGKLALNLGCGPMIWENWVNVDAYAKHPGILKADFVSPGFAPGTVDIIYSSHSLEHVPIHRGLWAFENWAELLKPGGILHLAVPDMENICKCLISPDVSEDLKWNWYVFALYGYQIAPEIRPHVRNVRKDLVTDPGQFHYVTFTKRRLEDLCRQHRLEIAELYSYDGYDTPSLYMKAIKQP